jgi:hypothetical protein
MDIVQKFETGLFLPEVVCTIVKRRGAEFTGARSPVLNVFKAVLIILAPQCGIFIHVIFVVPRILKTLLVFGKF